MELLCSPECPCRPAFVCNYCLIKHAGQLPGSGWPASDTQLYTECLRPPSIRVGFALLSNPLQKQLRLKPQQLPQYAIIQYLPRMAKCMSVCPSYSRGQVCSLSTHKDNTIILKRLWSLVIEFSKGTRVLWDRGGQLLECGELRGEEGGRLGEEENMKLVGPFDALHVEFANSKPFLANYSSTELAWQVTSHLDKRCLVWLGLSSWV